MTIVRQSNKKALHLAAIEEISQRKARAIERKERRERENMRRLHESILINNEDSRMLEDDTSLLLDYQRDPSIESLGDGTTHGDY